MANDEIGRCKVAICPTGVTRVRGLSGHTGPVILADTQKVSMHTPHT